MSLFAAALQLFFQTDTQTHIHRNYFLGARQVPSGVPTRFGRKRFGKIKLWHVSDLLGEAGEKQQVDSKHRRITNVEMNRHFVSSTVSACSRIRRNSGGAWPEFWGIRLPLALGAGLPTPPSMRSRARARRGSPDPAVRPWGRRRPYGQAIRRGRETRAERGGQPIRR